jgi:hypothetical protein
MDSLPPPFAFAVLLFAGWVKLLGRRRLAAVAGIVKPDTILRWYRTLVAKKYDGSKARRRGRPSTQAHPG